MTKKQIITREYNYEIMAGEAMALEPVRGKSAWRFTFPTKWEEFKDSIIREAVMCQYGWEETDIKLANRPEDDRYYSLSEDGKTVYLNDYSFDSYAVIRCEDNKVTVRTAWNGYTYEFSNFNGYVSLIFAGPRRALGAQNLMPVAVQSLLGYMAKKNPFDYLVGMYDANGDWFDANFIVGYYADKGWSLSNHLGYDGWWEEK